jgi:pilus assembly protein CpaF
MAEETESDAGRRKPPRVPPTGLGAPPAFDAPGPRPAGPRGKPRVVCFTGAKEGAGKSTIALNLALAWAGTQARNVVVVHFDPLCRNDLAFQLSLASPCLMRLVGSPVSVSQWGVGVVPLAETPSEARGLSPSFVAEALRGLKVRYDLFLDVEPSSPMQDLAFELADLVFWTSLPHRSHLEATYNMFQEPRLPLERFEVVVNAGNAAGALASKEVERFYTAMNKPVLSFLPWDDELPGCANAARLLVVERPQSDWVKALRPLLGRVMEI